MVDPNIKYYVFFLFAAVLMTACGNKNAKRVATENVSQETVAGEKQDAAPRSPQRGPVQYTYRIKNTYPHDTGAYTQGLYWHDGYLWESTGEYGRSDLRKVELETGKVLERVPLAAEYFGEGAALLNGKIYQLTWLEHKAFVYDAATLKKTGEFSCEGEGWGITADDEKLFMSDGTNIIRILDPKDFSRVSTLTVMNGRRSINMLNELEWIDGKIWANVYTTDMVVIIDPDTGAVEGIIDLSGLLSNADRTIHTDVLNGIAYDAEKGRIFVTGKRWNKLFEIELVEI